MKRMYTEKIEQAKNTSEKQRLLAEMEERIKAAEAEMIQLERHQSEKLVKGVKTRKRSRMKERLDLQEVEAQKTVALEAN